MKLNVLSAASVLAVALGLTGCASKYNPEPWNYDKFLASNPKSILVLMPTSESNNVDSGPAVLSTTVYPLARSGYYPMPVTLVNDTFKDNGVQEAAEIHNVSLKKLNEVFNADSILYLHIEKYDTQYKLTDSVTSVQVHAKLLDGKSGDLLWERTIWTTNATDSSGNALVDLVSAVIKHVVNEVTDQGYPVARDNARLLYNQYLQVTPILFGPRSQLYRKDPILVKIEQDKAYFAEHPEEAPAR